MAPMTAWFPGMVHSAVIALGALLAVALGSTMAAHAASEPRLALVIGNGAYTTAPALRNPPNDARLVAEALTDVGFTVNLQLDLGQKELKRAIQEFGRQVGAAGRDAVALFYYAGHSVQVGGGNFLIPVGAAIRSEGDVDLEGVAVGAVLSTLDFAGARVTFVVLDACRDNPYASGFRSATRGLAPVEAAAGSLIAYATSPGQVAYDGDGAHSPYSEALAAALRTPGLTVEKMFRRVRNQVMEATRDRQIPWESSSLTGGDFYFRAAKPAIAALPPAPASRAAPQDGETLTEGAPDPTAVDLTFWRSIKDSHNPADFAAYLERFPEGVFAPLARNRLAALSAPAAVEEVASPAPGSPEPDRVAALPNARAVVPPSPPRPQPEAAVDPLDARLFVQRNANVRSGPSTDDRRLTTLRAGTRVQATGRVRDQAWTQVALADGATGYIWSPLLGPEAPVADPPAPASPEATPPAASRPAATPPQTRLTPAPRPEPAPSAAARFDGSWTAILDIEPGVCPLGNIRYRFNVRVADGRISGQARFDGRPYAVTGRVSPDGAFNLSMEESYATVNARLDREGGQGRWQNRHGCFGPVTLLR